MSHIDQSVHRYVDHLLYPILLKVQNSGYYRIVEMQGRDINRWNDAIAEQLNKESSKPC